MKKIATGSAAGIALLGLAIWFFQARTPESPMANEGASTIQDTPSAASMRVYRDPVTGEFVAPPAGVAEPDVSKDLTDPLSTSSEGLVERRAPGGGTMIDLQGRFQHTATVTTVTDGKPVISCDTGSPTSSETADNGGE